MNFKQIEYVMAVAKYGSFVNAAKHLFISQPALSEQIFKLEVELGNKLFNRSRNGTSLTQFGKEFLTEADELVNKYNSFEAKMKNYSNQLIGTIHIGLYWAFGYTSIPEKLFSFLKERPEIDAEYIIDGSTSLEEKLLNKSLDVAFTTGYETDFEKKRIINIFIEDSPLVALVNSSHPFSMYNHIHFKDLSNQSILNISAKSNIYGKFSEYLKKYAHNVKIVGESSQMDAAYQIAKNNLGISFVSEEVAKTLKDPMVKRVSLSPVVLRNIYLVYHEDNKNNQIIKELIKTFRRY